MLGSVWFDEISRERDLWIERNQYYYNFIERLVKFNVPEEVKVLEVGCGTGNLIGNLRNRLRVGIDFSRKMIKVAKRKVKNVKFVNLDVERDEIPERFDWILAINLVGYLSDVYRAFERLKKNCSTETRVMVVYYNHLWEPVLRMGEHFGLRSRQPEQNWLGVDDLKNIFELLDYDIVRVGYHILLPFDIPLFSQFVNNFIASLPILKHFSLVQTLILRLKPTGRCDYSVSIIVPVRNEEGNVSKIIEMIPRFGNRQEVIFVEGHSKDESWREIEKIKEKYKKKNLGRLTIKAFKQFGEGKADAVRMGFDKASGEILIILDADLTVDPSELVKFYDAIASGKAEFVNGSRLVYPMEKDAMRFLNKVGNRAFSAFFTFIFGQRFKDTLCGTKAIMKKDYQRTKRILADWGRFDPFGDFDLIFGAVRLNLKILEMPVRYREREYGVSNISRIKHGWLLIKMAYLAFCKLVWI